MRIFFDGTTLCAPDGSPGAGIEQYTRALLRGLALTAHGEQIIVGVPSRCSQKMIESLFADSSHTRPVRSFFPNLPFVGRHLAYPLRALFTKPDLFFSPFGQLPLGWRGRKSVLTVHDVSIFEHPQWFPDESVRSFSTRVVVPYSIEHANHIICVSRFTQSRLKAVFPSVKGKTSVIHEGVEMGNHKEVIHTHRPPFDRDYLLCLGTIEPRKNLTFAFRAFERFLHAHPELATSVRLIVAGKLGWKTTEVEETAAAINHVWKRDEPDGVIQFLGAVTEEEKWYLLSRAAGLLFLSHEEGFGLPLLEAMSVGTPVVAARTGAIEEVAGDAALLVEPEDVVATSLAIAQCVLVPEGVQSVREQGYLRAKQFSWEKAARETLDIFHRILDK